MQGVIGYLVRTNMNTIQMDDLLLEVGRSGVVELGLLRKWLLLDEVAKGRWAVVEEKKLTAAWQKQLTPSSCRIAPSIVTRSEAELFGVSWPRFAIRVGLPGGSFVNARRVASLCGQVERWQTGPGKWNVSRIWDRLRGHVPEHPAHVLRFSRAVADGLLTTPNRLKPPGYHLITAPLGKANGECFPNTRDLCGTVYARHIKAGGGLCAQAACFMATALLPEHSKAVHGVAEVTALSRNKGKLLDDMSLSGLNPIEMQSYFQHEEVGLNGAWQVPTMAGDTDLRNLGGNILATSSVVQELSLGLESYVGSGFPVVYPVDVGRMAGAVHPKGIFPPPHYIPAIPRKRSARTTDPLRTHLSNRKAFSSIFDQNGLEGFHRVPFKAGKSYAHAIVIVGMQRTPPWRDDREFVFHDPLNFPFMQATACDLLLCGPYSTRSQSVVFGAFLPVVPAAVQMPMLSSCVPGNDVTTTLGLLDICEAVHSGAAAAPSQDPTVGFIQDPRESHFQLIHWREGELVRWIERLSREQRRTFPEHLVPPVETELQSASHRDRWVWLQWNREAIWVFDAEAPPPKAFDRLGNLAWSFVLAVGWYTGETPNRPVTWSPSKRAQADNSPSPPEVEVKAEGASEAALKFGFITSFSTSSLRESLVSAPEDAEYCELYTFMHRDAKALIRCDAAESAKRLRFVKSMDDIGRSSSKDGYPVPRIELSALERMATLEGKPAQIMEVARRVRQVMDASGRKELKIAALASYLPGLAEVGGPPGRSGAGVDALRAGSFLIRLAAAFIEIGESDLDTVEMVAGSLVRGIRQPKRGDEQGDFSAHILGEAAATRQLINSCKELVKVIEESGKSLRIAFEFEPGPLNVLGKLSRLDRFAECLEEEPALQRYISLNLDLAHFAFLANAKPQHLSERVRKLFCHAHISSHGRGHFSDAPLEEGRVDASGERLYLKASCGIQGVA